MFINQLILFGDNSERFMSHTEPHFVDRNEFHYHINIDNVEEFLSYWELLMDENGLLYDDKNKCVGKIQ